MVSASYQGLPVWLAGLKLCEMALYRDPETEMEKEEEREIFLGLWFACDLGKEIGCDCTITPKGVLGRLTGSRNALGSEVFARKFQVQTDRPDWAERLLTQPVQEAMLSLLSMGKTYLRLRPDGKADPGCVHGQADVLFGERKRPGGEHPATVRGRTARAHPLGRCPAAQPAVRSFSNRELGKEDPGEKQKLAGIFVVV